jgi:hypothetical protein
MFALYSLYSMSGFGVKSGSGGVVQKCVSAHAIMRAAFTNKPFL